MLWACRAVGGIAEAARLAAGATPFHSPYLLGRRGDLQERPGVFAPHRWGQEGAAPLRGTKVAFGGGARKRIGDDFGMAMAITALATVAQRWEPEPLPHTRVRPVPRAVLAPHALPMRPRHRQDLSHRTGAP
ncbi:cytochrome P450 [Streptomyces sp. NPDC054765]